jgi:hypothetical protein
MATTAETKVMTTGICTYCKGEFDKATMTQHLKHCKERAATIAASMKDGAGQKEKLFHILVEGRYNPQYWMHLEIPASEPLFSLDGFLRDVWVECCGHLSAFEIGGTTYQDDPGGFSFQVIGAEAQQGEEVEEDGDEEEEDEDLSPEEIAEEIGKLLDEEILGLSRTLPGDLQVELKKPRSRDELVAFLKEKLAAIPKRVKAFSFDEEERKLYNQQRTLQFLLKMVEDRSLSVPLEKVLKVRQKFSYEYDFGSTTELTLKVLAERDGVIQEGDDVITILARNVAPTILCKVCGKPATKVAGGYYNVEEHAYCNKCARRSEDADMMLPIVNSPRVGVCGYTG